VGRLSSLGLQVWICSPSQFHADQIAKCAKAGKRIFCEKPLATDLAKTIEAIKVRVGWWSSRFAVVLVVPDDELISVVCVCGEIP